MIGARRGAFRPGRLNRNRDYQRRKLPHPGSPFYRVTTGFLPAMLAKPCKTTGSLQATH
jgi:hypothetical protein